MSKRKTPLQEPAPFGWIQLHEDIVTILGVMPYEFSMEAVIQELEGLGWKRETLPSPQWMGGKFRAVTPSYTKSWTRYWTLAPESICESLEESRARKAAAKKALARRRYRFHISLG